MVKLVLRLSRDRMESDTIYRENMVNLITRTDSMEIV